MLPSRGAFHAVMRFYEGGSPLGATLVLGMDPVSPGVSGGDRKWRSGACSTACEGPGQLTFQVEEEVEV